MLMSQTRQMSQHNHMIDSNNNFADFIHDVLVPSLHSV